jgi:putative SOS response-associated peptidase YedK
MASMCGRFTLRASASVIAEQFGPFEMPPFAARFNIAPTQAVAVVRRAAARSGRELVWLRWGLIPAWAKDPAIGARLINARAETAAQKPAFRAAMRARRCLVVADGFYEWQRTGRTKQPYFFQLRGGRPLAFAGLWEAWRRPDESLLETCTLLTTAANELVRPVHDRMPVILAATAYDAWLELAAENPLKLASLLAPYPSGEMEARAVGDFVNSPAHDSPRCIEPVAAPG